MPAEPYQIDRMERFIAVAWSKTRCQIGEACEPVLYFVRYRPIGRKRFKVACRKHAEQIAERYGLTLPEET
jgi:hypothetical protein